VPRARHRHHMSFMGATLRNGPYTTINLFEVDLNTGAKLSEETIIWRGTGDIYPVPRAVRTGLLGHDSYGPETCLERAIVTICPSWVPVRGDNHLARYRRHLSGRTASV
jgi:hypothetical protein